MKKLDLSDIEIETPEQVLDRMLHEKSYSRLKGNYILMPQTETYAEGVDALQEACAKDPDCHPAHIFRRDATDSIYRPLTFKENIEARVEDYNTTTNPDGSKRSEDERLRLFNTWLDSCTGIAYKANTTKFKILPKCDQLITIDRDFNGDSLVVDYDSFNAIEIDTTQDIYDTLLTKEQVLEHKGWLAAVEEDEALLQEYADIMFSLRSGDLMRFWIRKGVTTDELRALYVLNLGNYSNANGGNDLNSNGRFVRAAQNPTPL